MELTGAKITEVRNSWPSHSRQGAEMGSSVLSEALDSVAEQKDNADLSRACGGQLGPELSIIIFAFKTISKQF